MKKFYQHFLSLVFGIHLTLNLHGQILINQNCLDSLAGMINEGTEQTLCQKFGSAQGYVDWDNSMATNGIIYTSSLPSNSLTNRKIHLSVDLHVNTNFTFTRCTLKIDPNVKIVFTDYVDVKVIQSLFFACTGLWEGIELKSFAKNTMTGSEIEDARKAINSSSENSYMVLTSNKFNRNKTGINLEYYSLSNPGNSMLSVASAVPRLAVLDGNHFTATSPLNDGWQWGDFGIRLINVPLIVRPLNLNYFSDLLIGIRMTGFNTLMASKLQFQDIVQNSIDFSFGTLNLSYCYFKNVGLVDLNVLKPTIMDVNNCVFSNNYQGKYKQLYEYSSIRVSDLGYKANCYIHDNEFNLFHESPTNENTIRFKFIGIDIKSLNVFGTTVTIRSNPMKLRGQSCAGIIIRGSFPKSSSTLISYHDFLIDQYNQASPHAAISLIDGDKNNFTIEENTVNNFWEFDSNFDSSTDGIYLDGSIAGTNNYVLNNYFYTASSTSFGRWGRSAIKVNNFNAATIAYNEIYNCCYYPMNISGINDLRIKCNKFYGAGQFILNNAMIHPQTYFGNEWLGWPIGTHTLHPDPYDADCIGCSDDVVRFFSKFWMHEPQSTKSGSNFITFYPTHPALVNPDQNNEWFEYKTNHSADCALNLTFDSTQIGALELIAEDNINEVFSSTTASNISKRALFYKLNNIDTSLKSVSNSLDSFFNNFSNSDLGKIASLNNQLQTSQMLDSAAIYIIHNYSDTLNTILQDSFLTMVAELDTMYTDTTLVSTYLSFSDEYFSIFERFSTKIIELNILQDSLRLILLDTLENVSISDSIIQSEINALIVAIKLLNNIEIDTSESDYIFNLASLCPNESGFGVYVARSLIKCPFSYSPNNCESSEEDSEDDDLALKGLPAPKNHKLISNFDISDAKLEDDLEYLIFSIEGKLINSTKGKSNIVNLNIPNGIYFVLVKGNKSKTNELYKWIKNWY